MWSQIYFKRFDLKTGETDDEFPLQALSEQWANRARSIIDELNTKELSDATNLFDWMNSDYNDVEKAMNRLIKEVECDEEGHLVDKPFPHHSLATKEALALKYEYNLESFQAGKSPIKWSNLFAIAGINMIAEAYDEDLFQRTSRNDTIRDELARLDMANYFLYPAVELIGLAELEHVYELNNKELQGKVSNKISLRNKKAAIARHAKTRTLKNDFIFWYYENRNKNRFPSKAKAAEIFYESLPKTKKILAPTNAARTLLDALRAYENDKSRD